jgi:hypothetical protein
MARKACSECKALREAGPDAMAIKIHELLAILEEEEVLDADHPSFAQISEKIEGARYVSIALTKNGSPIF